MYKPNDIVAVYGEVGHGGTLLHDRHDVPKDRDDAILKRYVLMDVVEEMNADALLVKSRDGGTKQTFVHPRQCRLVSRNGTPVEPKRAEYLILANDEDKFHEEVRVDSASSVRGRISSIIETYADDNGIDQEDAENDITFFVYKAIDISDEFGV